MTYNTQQEQKIKASAETALAELAQNPELAAEAKKNRATLFDWLASIQLAHTDPSSSLDTAVAGGMLRTFLSQHGVDVELDLANVVADSFVKAYIKGTFNFGGVYSSSQDRMPEATGFIVDADLKTVFAKVGNAPYQPIGFDDGEHYIPLENSKTLWARKFEVVMGYEKKPPFKVILNKAPEIDIFSDQQMLNIKAAAEYLAEDLDAFMRAEPDKKKEADDKLRFDLSYARMQCIALDQKLNAVYEANPGLGKNFENTEITQLVYAAKEYLDFLMTQAAVNKINKADTIAEESGNTTLTLSRLLVVAIESNDPDTLSNAISQVYSIRPDLRQDYKDKTVKQVAITILEGLANEPKV